MRLPLLALLAFATSAAAQNQRTMVPIPTGQLGGAPHPSQPAATIVVEPVGMMIAGCDANGDARVTRAELEACVARSFADADTAHAGTIGYIAYSDWALKWLGDRNALPSPFTVDADGNDRITLAELQAQFATLFTRLDADKDGVLTRAELLTIKSGVVADERGGKHKRR